MFCNNKQFVRHLLSNRYTSRTFKPNPALPKTETIVSQTIHQVAVSIIPLLKFEIDPTITCHANVLQTYYADHQSTSNKITQEVLKQLPVLDACKLFYRMAFD